MKSILFGIVQCTWGLPQTLLGLVIFLCSGRRYNKCFHGAFVCLWRYPFSVSLGMFIFISQQSRFCRELRVHEYGHCVQSLILGPLYLPLVMLPSMLWLRLPICKKRRLHCGSSYYGFITERTADNLGERVCREKSMGRSNF